MKTILKTNNYETLDSKRLYRLMAFSEEPIKKGNVVTSPAAPCKVYELDSELFPEITFENSPHLVEIKLVKED